jgi:phosphate acetyltransferase
MPLPLILEQIIARAKERDRHILVADAEDERMLIAARIAQDEHIARITLIGIRSEIEAAATRANVSVDDFKVWHPSTCPVMDALTNTYFEGRAGKVATPDDAKAEIMSDPLLMGAVAIRNGDADGMLAGSVSTTAAVIRAGIRGIGLRADLRVLSSMFLMIFPKIEGMRETDIVLAFADGAVIPDPDHYQLADIAIATADTYTQLTANEARVAMLSFSTKGSASNESTKKVITATEIARERRPDLIIDGELQFDAAFVPHVAERKSPESPLNGNANVFIFPNLDAGNLGYKIAERLGMGHAIGPILQGLSKPVNDLSRGAKVEDIVTMIAVTALEG